MNKVFLSGRWTRDFDCKALDDGSFLAKCGLAVENGYGDKKNTDFHEVELWGKLAENIANHSGKGRKVLIEGRLKIDKWEQDGQRREKTKVVASYVEFLDFKNDQNHADTGNTSGSGYDPFADDGKPIDISDDDLPF